MPLQRLSKVGLTLCVEALYACVLNTGTTLFVQNQMRRLMEQVAYWVHTQGGTGEQQGGTLIDRDELVAKLAKDIQKLKRREQLEFYEAEAEAERFLDYIRDRTGLLNEQGKDRYAFVHKTFQEYLTACEILYRERNQDLGDPETYKPEVVNHIREHSHNAHWREVLLLLVAQQPPKPASRCIKTILQYSDCYEKYLHRNLFFAASCLAEDVEISNAQVVEQILEDLVALEIEAKTLSSIQRQVSKTLSSLAATQYEPIALQHLMNVPEGTIEEDRLRNYRVELGDRLNVVEEYLLLFADPDPGVRYRAAEAVGNLGQGSPEVIEKLLDLFAAPDPVVRSSAAFAVGNLGQGSPEVMEKLLDLFADPDSVVRYSAAEAVGNLGQGSPEVIEKLLDLFADPDSGVRYSAAEAVGNLGQGSPEVMEKLLDLFADPDSGVRYRAAFAVGNLGQGSPEVMEKLLDLFADPDSGVRYRAAEAVGKLGQGSPEVMEKLLDLFADPDSVVRSSAAFAVGKLGKNLKGTLDSEVDGNVLEALVNWLETHPDLEGVANAVDALWSLIAEV
ncbi:HEAT repeat domain-containing protein [filamentous cyanobacterium LEGE 07170]|nr:HEAT repeat domain-containing protein [filamentous cyanobacterium LEGE 07170]